MQSCRLHFLKGLQTPSASFFLSLLAVFPDAYSVFVMSTCQYCLLVSLLGKMNTVISTDENPEGKEGGLIVSIEIWQTQQPL